MSNFAKAATIVLVPALLAVGGTASRTASAQTAPAPAAQPCSGTLCDLYYGNRGPTPATATSTSPSATQQGVPVTVPSGNIFSGLFNGGTQAASSGTAAPNAQQQGSTPFVRVVGGRPANEPCTGTLCDLFHSGDPSPPPQRTGQQQASAASPVEPVAARGPARRTVPAPQPKPICHNDRDPWQCYR